MSGSSAVGTAAHLIVDYYKDLQDNQTDKLFPPTRRSDLTMPEPTEPIEPTVPAWRPWAWRAAKVLILAGVAWGAHGTIQNATEQLGKHSWQIRPWWLVLAGVIYLIGLAPAGWYWRKVLAAFGQTPSWLAIWRAYYIGHLGKYAPGKALVLILRAGFISKECHSRAAVVVSIFMETLTMMAVGAAVAVGLSLAVLHLDAKITWLGIGCMVVAGLPTLPPIIKPIVQFINRKKSNGKSSDEKQINFENINFSLMAQGWVAMTIGWVLLGLSLTAVCQGIEMEESVTDGSVATLLSEMPRMTAAVSLAMVAGFLSLIPGGLLVRDLILMQVLSPVIGEGKALIAAALLRIIWIMSEAVISAILWSMGGTGRGESS